MRPAQSQPIDPDPGVPRKGRILFAISCSPVLWPIDTRACLCYVEFVDPGERYQQLCLLGRDTFLDAVAEAALVLEVRSQRIARGTLEPLGAAHVTTDDLGQEIALVRARAELELGLHRPRPQVLPLAKKKGTPFVDLITIGRTASNDVTLDDLSVSRFQAFVRARFGRWFICDAGSRNGTRIDGTLLKARSEVEIKSGQLLQFGLLHATFHTADTLYDFLSTRSSL